MKIDNNAVTIFIITFTIISFPIIPITIYNIWETWRLHMIEPSLTRRQRQVNDASQFVYDEPSTDHMASVEVLTFLLCYLYSLKKMNTEHKRIQMCSCVGKNNSCYVQTQEE